MIAEPTSAKSIFLNAAERPAGSDRQAYLSEACGHDASLRREVDELLAHLDKVGNFLESPELLPNENAPRSADSAGMVIASRYKLIHLIGEGGMGTVWKAEQTEPVERVVAVKLIKPGMNAPQIVTRFEAERQALALMDHPNIAKVLDGGTTLEGRPFFVMELVDGVPITNYCDDQHLTPRERLKLFIPVCQAVQHAHQKAIIHRDLKPSNVLVARYDPGGSGVPKVIDFGVAKAINLGQVPSTPDTGFGTIVGTVEYMSPEQAGLNHLDVDARSDVYSLGVLLYELLAGATPVDRKQLETVGLMETLRVIREQEPPKPSTKLSRADGLPALAANRGTQPEKLTGLVRGELDWIVMKCLEKDRDRRYQTANALAVDLQRYLDHEPVSAGPPGSAYRVRKFVQRQRGAVLASAFLLFALVGGLIGTTWGLFKAERARDAEADARRGEAERANAEAWQRQRADDERERAQEEKQIAQAVQRFLEIGLLRQADPFAQAEAVRLAGGGFEARENPSVKELVDRAAAELSPDKIEAKFPNRPRVQAEILRTIGRTYLGIGEYAKAIAHLTRARDLMIVALGRNDPVTLATTGNLAVAHRRAGRTREAIAQLEALRAQAAAALGPEHSITLTAMDNLAGAYVENGQPVKAIAMLEAVRDVRVATQGPKHLHTFITLDNLATAYRRARRSPEAVALLESVRDEMTAELTPNHPTTLAMLDNLAGAYQEVGRVPEAIALYEKVRVACENTLSVDHPQTLATMNNLAAAYWRAKQLDRSVPLFEETLQRSEARLGEDHPDTLMTLANLGVNYRDAGKMADGIARMEEALARARKRPGGMPTHVVWVPGMLADTYDRDGQFAKSELHYRWMLEQASNAKRQDPSRIALYRNWLGLNLLRQRKGAEAEPELRQSLEYYENAASADWRQFETKALLGGALLLEKKYSDAEPFLKAGYEGMRQRFAEMPPRDRPRVRETLDRLIELAEALADNEAAAKWRAERATLGR